MSYRERDLIATIQAATELLKSTKTSVSFPEHEDLIEIAKVYAPDFPDLFRKGAQTYRAMISEGKTGNVLCDAALSLYLSYQDPPRLLKLAIVDLLRSGVSNADAYIYAFEYLPTEAAESIAAQELPLITRDGKVDVSHLCLAVRKPVDLLYCITAWFMNSGKVLSDKLRGLEACISAVNQDGEPFPALTEAVTALLYGMLVADNETAQRQLVSQILEQADDNTIASALLKMLADRQNCSQSDLPVRNCDTQWSRREELFLEKYQNKSLNGFLFCSQNLAWGTLFHPGSHVALKLSETTVSRYSEQIQREKKPYLVAEARYKLTDGAPVFESFKPVSEETLSSLSVELKKISNLRGNKNIQAAIRYLQKHIDNIEVVRKAEQYYQHSAISFDELLRLFQRYIAFRHHDQRISRKMIADIATRSQGNMDPQFVSNVVRYYLSIGDHEHANSFFQSYCGRLSTATAKRLEETLSSCKDGNASEPINPYGHFSEWTPFVRTREYDNYFLHFITQGDALLEKNGIILEESGDKIQKITDTLMAKGDEYATTKAKLAADYYLMACSASFRYEQFRDPDLIKDCMISALYFYSISEANSIHEKEDVRCSYLLHMLGLSGMLDSGYLGQELSDIVEDAEKRYFKKHRRHGDNSLTEAMKYMIGNQSESSFVKALIQLSVYYPKIINPISSSLDWVSDSTIQKCLLNNLSSYTQEEHLALHNLFPALRAIRDNITDELSAFLSPYYPSPETVEECFAFLLDRLKQIENSTLFKVMNETDQKNVQRLVSISESFPERIGRRDNALLEKCIKSICGLKEQIAESPTSFSLNVLGFLLDEPEKALRIALDSLYNEADPCVRVEAKFAEKSKQQADCIRVFLWISFDKERSFIQDIALRLSSPVSTEFVPVEDIMAEERGAYCTFVEVPLPQENPPSKNIEFDVELRYTIAAICQNKKETFHLSAASINLSLNELYPYLYNAGKKLGTDASKVDYTFYGRDRMIENICETFESFDRSVIVLFGQKKVGKTTVANYVTRKMKDSGSNYLVVPCGHASSGTGESADQKFFEALLLDICDAIKNSPRQTTKELTAFIEQTVTPFKSGSIDSNLFRFLLRELRSAMAQDPNWRGVHLLLYYDEFQRYYFDILEGKRKPEFIHFIKEFTETYDFSLLLVGCEPMIEFISDPAFGNAFSTANLIQVKYLDEEDARKLISEPITLRYNRDNPFKYVEDDIITLTAGSAYYIQHLCSKLILQLNLDRRVYANPQMLIDILGDSTKTAQAVFDCLSNPLNQRENAATDGDNKLVLTQIAVRYGSGKTTTKQDIVSDLTGRTEKDVEEILSGLINREVIREEKNNLRITVRMYEVWLWLNRAKVGFIPFENPHSNEGR